MTRIQRGNWFFRRTWHKCEDCLQKDVHHEHQLRSKPMNKFKISSVSESQTHQLYEQDKYSNIYHLSSQESEIVFMSPRNFLKDVNSTWKSWSSFLLSTCCSSTGDNSIVEEDYICNENLGKPSNRKKNKVWGSDPLSHSFFF